MNNANCLRGLIWRSAQAMSATKQPFGRHAFRMRGKCFAKNFKRVNGLNNIPYSAEKSTRFLKKGSPCSPCSTCSSPRSPSYPCYATSPCNNMSRLRTWQSRHPHHSSPQAHCTADLTPIRASATHIRSGGIQSGMHRGMFTPPQKENTGRPPAVPAPR